MRYIKKYCETTTVPWCLLGALSLLSTVGALLYLARPMDVQVLTWLIGTTIPVGGLLYMWLCFHGSGRFLKPAHLLSPGLRICRRFCPALLAMTLFFFVVSTIYWFIHTVILNQPAIYPSFQQYVLFASYPCLICALLFLPAHTASLFSRIRIFLDSLIILTALTALYYYFILAPILVASTSSLQEKLVAGLFPEADLVLLFCLLLVALRSGETALRPVLIFLGISIVSLFLNHVLHLSEVLSHTYARLPLSNGILFLNGVLTVGAAQTLRRILDRGAETVEVLTPEKREESSALYPGARWKAMLPPALVLVFGLLVFGLWLRGGSKSFPGEIVVIYIGAFLVLLLMVLRQFLAVYEINKLQGAVRRRNRSLNALNEQLARLATTDALTGLPNHRALAENLNAELTSAETQQSVCSLLFIDIDHFKSINDRYGHLIGDTVLRQFGELARSTLRSTDHLGRWGGEEFVAVLPGTSARDALTMAERIRQRVEWHLFVCEGVTLRLTCSLGIATYPVDASEQENLIMLADAAMYAAKRLGHNQTRIAREPGVLALGTGTGVAEVPETREVLSIVEALVSLQEVRDQLTSQHERRVAVLTRKLALTLGLNESEAYKVSLGGLLHDLGKVALPDKLLLKRGRLSEQEFRTVRAHPVTGAQVLNSVPTLREVAAIVRGHHEWMDGSGYPDQLQGEEIPLGARIVAVADAYDVITHNRPYQHAHSSAAALRAIQKSAGPQFDPQVVDALVDVLADDPLQLTDEVA